MSPNQSNNRSHSTTSKTLTRRLSSESLLSKIRRKSSYFDEEEKNNRKKIKKERLKKEDHLSTIFMGYVLVFLICHTPRLALNFYELTAIRRGLECERFVFNIFQSESYFDFINKIEMIAWHCYNFRLKEAMFPVYVEHLLCINDLLLVINSSINFLIYRKERNLLRYFMSCTKILTIILILSFIISILQSSRH